jgi:hypothetical protein
MQFQAPDRGPPDNIIYCTDLNMTAYDLTWETSGIAEEWLSKELQNMAIVHMPVLVTFLSRAKLCTHIYATMTHGGERKVGGEQMYIIYHMCSI